VHDLAQQRSVENFKTPALKKIIFAVFGRRKNTTL